MERWSVGGNPDEDVSDTEDLDDDEREALIEFRDFLMDLGHDGDENGLWDYIRYLGYDHEDHDDAWAAFNHDESLREEDGLLERRIPESKRHKPK